MSTDKLFGDFSALQGQFKNLTSTVKAGKAQEITHDWFYEYAHKNGWWSPKHDALEAFSGRKFWKGIPSKASATRIQIHSTIAKNSGAGQVQVSNGILWRAKMTGIGMAKHPTWVGESLLVLSLIDRESAHLSAMSVLCESKLSLAANLLSGFGGKPMGIDLGKPKELKIEDSDASIEGFRLYAANPANIDSTLRRRIKKNVEGWTGHIRLQGFPSVGVGVYMAWDWRGGERGQWSKDLDTAIEVLQGVRDACVARESR
jgi:hypothetical protein